MNSPYTPAKIAAATWFALALLAMFVGLMLSKTALFPIGVVVAVAGFASAVRNFGLLARIAAAEQVLRGDAPQDLDPRAQRGSLPQKVFLLLSTVAEADGHAAAAERELILRFMLERFPDARVQAELRSWQITAVPEAQLGPLIHDLRRQLRFWECETLFYWCCLTALVDQRFNQQEHEVLQRVSRHLGLPGEHARRIFLHAKHRLLESAGQAPGTGAGQRANRRERALQILGLDETATREDIRRRHRELVKKYHPDTRSRLGPVAQQEATERFREIQDAYETLSAG